VNEQPKIYVALSKVMAAVGAIGKNRKNEAQKYNFRGIDDVMNAFQPALIDAGVVVLPRVVEQTREERTTRNGGGMIYTILRVQFTFYAADGSSVMAETVGEGMDSGDKSANKALSAAFKYAMLQIFCVPTEEQDDADYHSHEVVLREQPAKPPTRPQPAKADKPDELAALGKRLMACGITKEQLQDRCEQIGGVRDSQHLEPSDRAKVVYAFRQWAGELEQVNAAQ